MQRFRFPKSEKLKSKKCFEETLLYGKKLYSENQTIRCFYQIKNFTETRLQAAFIVGKRNGIAVWRNRFKRVLREIFRLHKHNLISSLEKTEKSLYVIFSSHRLQQKQNRILRYKDFEMEMLGMMSVIQKDIELQ
ncbi:MAG: ribonuclease P protein component [Bacteroidetes bacterium]|nr:ribonuclease P protein component [Bacteroidota bacterium]